MNNFFLSKVQSILHGLKLEPPSLEGCQQIMGNKKISLSLRYIPVKKVKHLLRSLKNKTSTSMDQLDNYAVKLAANYIAEPLHHVITLSLMQNKFPSGWKLTKIVPLHKKGCPLKKENYRPVAILSPLSKVLEKAIFEQVYDYFHWNKLFHPSLHGYRVHRSTTTALLSMYDKWAQAASKGQLSGVVLVDLSAAFDLVSHDLLIQKLKLYGLDESFLIWISSYLSERYQSVWIDHVFSDFMKNSTGVPQGSNLGPLLFLIFFNDLPMSINNDVECYADDSTVSASSERIEVIEEQLTLDCNSLSKWMRQNRFKLNHDKTQFLVTGTTTMLKNMEAAPKVYMDGARLQQSLSCSELLLGVKIQQNLKWSEQIQFVESKLKIKMGGLEKLKYVMSRFNRRVIVEGIFNSVLLYGLSVFGGCRKQDIKSLQIQQNRAARLVLCAPPRTCTRYMLNELKWLSVNQLISYHTLIMVFRIRQSKEPEHLANCLLRDSRQGRIMLDNVRHESYRQSFIYRGATLWNQVPSRVRNVESLSSFKKLIKPWILDNVEAMP